MIKTQLPKTMLPVCLTSVLGAPQLSGTCTTDTTPQVLQSFFQRFPKHNPGGKIEGIGWLHLEKTW